MSMGSPYSSRPTMRQPTTSEGTPQHLKNQILAMFQAYGVDPAYMGPSSTADASRIDRLTQEVMQGNRNWHDLELSVMRLAASSTSGVRAQILNQFIQAGIPLSYHQDGSWTETPLNRLNRMEREVTTGQRRLQDTATSIEGLRAGYMQYAAQTDYGRRGAPVGTPTGGPPSPPGTAPSDDPTALQRDAFASLMGVFREYDLGDDFSDWVWQQIVAGRSQNEVLLDLYSPGNAGHDAFRRRFEGIFARQEAGLTPMSPAEIVAYEQALNQRLTMAGMDQFYTRGLVTRLVANDISLAEAAVRIDEGLEEVAYSGSEIRDAFAEFYGVQGDQALAMLYLDPELALPELERMTRTAVVGGIGDRFQVNLKEDRASRIGDIGYSKGQLQEGFMQIEGMKGLLEETYGESAIGQDYTAEGEGADAVFGLGEGARERIERRRRQRIGDFSGQDNALLSERGLGLGASD